jgi:asparagine synthase (glutamine-hydrolysing)
MCGITGYWNFKQTTPREEFIQLLKAMSLQIAHRGPDSWGAWCDEDIGLGFGHRRLSIVDLSEAGHQPMVSHSGRSVITYNGEIYNASELRAELIAKGCQFRGHSDTEVILEACEVWGVEATCQRLMGMFAFGFWDRKNRTLFLGRDRLGIKPLYWGFNKGILFFGSQVKSFMVHPAWESKIDKNALTAYFRFSYVPTPLSIFEGIHKLSPGTILSIDSNGKTHESRFWDFHTIVEKGIARRRFQSEVELIEELDVLLRDAVKRRMVADVPLGSFLSGGIDSSTVVALMQAQSISPVKSFSIGFYEQEYNEAEFAAHVAKHLGTEHHALYLHAKEAQDIILDIPIWFDEPFADVAQIPTFLVSRMAREHITVSLSGDGGDELFAGYNRYLIEHSIWYWVKLIPYWLRKIGANGIRKISSAHWKRISRMMPARLRPQLLDDKVYKLADIMLMSGNQNFYRSSVSHWEHPEAVVLGGQEEKRYPWIGTGNISFESFIENMQFLDTLTYLPDDILTKVDRASMAVGLEARVPLLDHRVVEFAWQLPLQMKIRHGKGKWLLRQVLNRYVPRELFERPKKGFGVPIGEWLRGPLRDWAEDLLSYDLLKNQGLLDPEIIQTRWKDHLSLRRNWECSLWGVLMFQAWYMKWANSFSD